MYKFSATLTFALAASAPAAACLSANLIGQDAHQQCVNDDWRTRLEGMAWSMCIHATNPKEANDNALILANKLGYKVYVSTGLSMSDAANLLAGALTRGLVRGGCVTK